jgi:manganese oxidase
MKKLAGRLVVALTVTAAAAAPVACGSDSAGEPAAKPATASAKPAASTDRVVIRNFAFPTTAAVEAGTKLTFANEDNASHTATSTAGLFDTDGIDKGERATVTLRKPGTYAYYCAFHPYMKGRIVVR